MTETFNPNPTAEDIDDATDAPSVALDRQADALLATAASDRPQADRSDRDRVESVRQALRDDVSSGREWARQRAQRATEAVREEPLKATLYALGLGLLVGLLVAR